MINILSVVFTTALIYKNPLKKMKFRLKYKLNILSIKVGKWFPKNQNQKNNRSIN